MRRFVSTDDWIARIPEEIGRAIMGRMRKISVAAGAEFSHAGDQVEAFFRVETGYLKLISPQEDGRQILIAIYGPGACFAETALIDRRPLHHSTVAICDTRVGILGAADFWYFYNHHSEIADALCRKFSNAISSQILYREEKATQRLAQRIAIFFDELARVCGRVQQDGAIEIPLPITQTDLAEHFDVTRQTIHRELGELRSMDLITRIPGGWLIKNGQKMAEMAVDAPGPMQARLQFAGQVQ